MKVSIKDLDKATVLAALYNNAKPMGMGFLHYTAGDMTIEEANKCLELGDDSARMFPGIGRKKLYFDYLKGRCLKVNLSEDEFDAWGYDRDYGEGAAKRVIAGIR